MINDQDQNQEVQGQPNNNGDNSNGNNSNNNWDLSQVVFYNFNGTGHFQQGCPYPQRQEPKQGRVWPKGQELDLYFDYHPNYGKGNWKLKRKHLLQEVNSNLNCPRGILVMDLQVSKLFLAHQFNRNHNPRMNKLLIVHPHHHWKLQMQYQNQVVPKWIMANRKMVQIQENLQRLNLSSH